MYHNIATENLLSEVNVLGNVLYIQRNRHKELALTEFNTSSWIH
ncbi:hypothetical protein [Vagococcus carniphilus]